MAKAASYSGPDQPEPPATPWVFLSALERGVEKSPHASEGRSCPHRDLVLVVSWPSRFLGSLTFLSRSPTLRFLSRAG